MSEPGYWMHEASGTLRPAVERFLHGKETEEDLMLVRAYLKQWIGASAWDANPHGLSDGMRLLRATVGSLNARREFDRWLEVAVREGVDPL